MSKKCIELEIESSCKCIFVNDQDEQGMLSVSGVLQFHRSHKSLIGVDRQNLPGHHVGWHKDDLLREFLQSHQSGSQFLLGQRQPCESRRRPSKFAEPFVH